MNTRSFKTYSAKPDDIEHNWYVVDATNVPLGRLASRIAHVLRGKHKPMFTPHMDTGDYVVVVHADAVRLKGKKETQKVYRTYSGYPGGERKKTAAEVRASTPERMIEHAVKGMLPSGSLGRDVFKKLKVYAGADHPHAAQQPRDLSDIVDV